MSKTTQRRDEARAQALKLKEEQAKAARRQRTLLIALVTVGLLVVGGAIAWILSNQPEPLPDLSQAEDPISEVIHPSTANETGGIVVGQDGVAGGETADDAVVVTVFEDYMCPVCNSFEQTNAASLTALREAGDVTVEYRPVSILDRASLGSQFSTRAAAAAGVVADRAPEAFVAFNAAMYANQPAEGTQGLTDEQIADIAREAGAPDDVADAIAAGEHMDGEGAFAPWVVALTEQAMRDFTTAERGFGTPTILLDGENLSDLGIDWRVPGALETAIQEARG